LRLYQKRIRKTILKLKGEKKMAQARLDFDNGPIMLEGPPVDNGNVSTSLTITVVNGTFAGITAVDGNGQALAVDLKITPQGAIGNQCKCLVGGVWVNCPCG
jgi:hypothetical protein